jgi:gliding motility-associated-like protein
MSKHLMIWTIILCFVTPIFSQHKVADDAAPSCAQPICAETARVNLDSLKTASLREQERLLYELENQKTAVKAAKNTEQPVKQKAFHFEELNAMIFIPETFTPDGDGVNDMFFITGAISNVLKIEIFTPKGELVFMTTSPYSRWDGNTQGNVVYGIYEYKITVGLGNNLLETINGMVEAENKTTKLLSKSN